jgi:hypothetical protein
MENLTIDNIDTQLVKLKTKKYALELEATSKIDREIKELKSKRALIVQKNYLSVEFENKKLKDIFMACMEKVFLINARGYWDAWATVTAHCDYVQFEITRHGGDYHHKLWKSQSYYRFNDLHPSKSIEVMKRDFEMIRDVLTDFLELPPEEALEKHNKE